MTGSHHEVITIIMDVLLGPEDRRITHWVDDLCKRNERLTLGNTIGFICNGHYYKPSNVSAPLPTIQKKPVHESLYDEVILLETSKQAIDLDKSLIRQSLFALCYPCYTNQQIRDALPECLVSTVPGFQGLSRTSEEAWSIKDNARAMRQYLKVLPRIEMYVAARMIY